MAHALEFSALLAVEQLAFFAEDGEGGYASTKWDLVLGGDVLVLVHVADVDVDEYVVGVKQGQVPRIVEVEVEDLAVAAPVAAEVEDDAFVGLGGCLEGGGDVSLGLGRFGIDVVAGRAGGGDAEDKKNGDNWKREDCELEGLQWENLR